MVSINPLSLLLRLPVFQLNAQPFGLTGTVGNNITQFTGAPFYGQNTATMANLLFNKQTGGLLPGNLLNQQLPREDDDDIPGRGNEAGGIRIRIKDGEVRIKQEDD